MLVKDNNFNNYCYNKTSFYLPEFNATCNNCYAGSMSRLTNCDPCNTGYEYKNVRIIERLETEVCE